MFKSKLQKVIGRVHGFMDELDDGIQESQAIRDGIEIKIESLENDLYTVEAEITNGKALLNNFKQLTRKGQ